MTVQRRVTFEDIAHLPLPGMNAPVMPRFSPDGRYLCYLYSAEGTLTRELWAYDRETGREFRLLAPVAGGDSDATVSREEALRRERQRQMASGVTSYAWSERGDTLLVPARGGVYVRRGAEGEPRLVAEGGCIDPKLSPDGRRVAFVRDGELYALDLEPEGGEARRLTFDASAADEHGDRPRTNGLAEFIAQEEMGRASGYWWSPDGDWLAYEQVDASPVSVFLIPHPGADAIDLEAHRYPFAGKANVRVRLGVVQADGGETRWLSMSDEPDCYLARVNWTPDGKLLVQVQSRDQTRLDLIRFDPATGKRTFLFQERCAPWLNLTDDLRFLHREDAPPEQYQILWSAEREGRRSLYLYEPDGQPAGDGRPIAETALRGVSIDEVRALDSERGDVFVEGWDDTPTERHLFRVSIDMGSVERLSTEPGTHRAVLAPDFQCYADSFSSLNSPPGVTLRTIDGSIVARLQSDALPDERLAALQLSPPELLTIAARDGETLHAALYRTAALPVSGAAPVVVQVYGGPHAQTVTNEWALTANMRAHLLTEAGFHVFRLDNRGSARRGLAFEGAIAGNLGDLEVRDQVDGVRYLAALPGVDAKRTGVYGWSYGGYMALMCLARAPEVFKVGVAGAPVTHWDGYDTHYTEQYMGHPAANVEGYQRSSVLAHAGNIRGALLLVHGAIDENVHFRHTARLINALVAAGVPYDLMLFPEERHSPRREEDRVYMERRIFEFFRDRL